MATAASPMDRFVLFLKELRKLEEGLEALNHEFADLYREFEGADFADQNKYANHLNDLLEATTHGSASDIGFARKALVVSAAYIGFRKKYKCFSDAQLAQIIDDDNLSSELKLALKRQLSPVDNQQFLATLVALKKEWNAAFNNKTYQQIKTTLTF